MSTEEAFIEFVRRERRKLFRPGVPPETVALLGLDDSSLEHWSDSPATLVSLPHASPNVFHPRTRVGWFVGQRQRRSPDHHHLRVTLTHTNFSDLGWRPYGWWYLTGTGEVRCARLFSRNKKRKHVVIGSRPALETVPDGVAGADLAAARAAIWGADLAVSYMLISAVIERAAGMVRETSATYLPLTLLVRFAQEQGERGGDHAPAARCRRLLAAADGRRVNGDGFLEPCEADRADVLDNHGNLALLSLLRRPHVVGGAKMAGYWPQVEAVLARLPGPAGGPDCLPPRVLTVPDRDLLAVAGPTPNVADQLAGAGVGYSQGLAVAEHGPFAARHDPFEAGTPARH